MQENTPQPEQQHSSSVDQEGHSSPKHSVQDLRSQLESLTAEKEKWFQLRQEYGQQIRSEIERIKGSMKQRNELTAAVQEEKKKRDELNKTISEKIKVVKDIKPPEKEKGTDAFRNPDELRRQIVGMEKKIETEGLSFDKEKQLMKQINSLRKQYDEAKKKQEEYFKSRGLSKEIIDLKKQANEVHKHVQEQAKESQKQHEVVVAESKKITDLKKKEKEAMEKFLDLKKQCNELFAVLKQEQAVYAEHKKVKHKEYEHREKSRKEHEKKTLQEKVRSVEEKIKKGGKVKLTMEDLIAFQGLKENE